MRRGPRLSTEELAPYMFSQSQPATNVVASPGEPPAPFDWLAAFGNERPVELEVGFGKGLFLLTAAQAHPDVNFVGVEIVRKYQLYAATRLAKRGLTNVRVACADVRWFLPRIPASSLQAVHVYFPDPWWKKRHHKRRVFTAEFVAECVRVLLLGGRLHAVTDVAEYAEVMSGLLGERADLLPLPPPLENSPAHDLDYLTNFERKFRKQGKPIYRMTYERARAKDGRTHG